MKKLCGLLLSALILLYACQKEVSFENGNGLSAEGSLQSDISGDCLPKEVAGTYEAGTELVATANTMEVTVDVSKTGPYLIYTDTVNGYFFRASGTFSATGLNTVTLAAKGTPLVDGIDNFAVRFDTTVCIVPVTVLPAGAGGPATLTLAGSPTTCLDYTVNGSYVIGTTLTTSNTVSIKVNVTVPGTYTITSQASNGMTFSGTGTVGSTGEQFITLQGSGTPATAGTTQVPISYNGNQCSFSIEVTATPSPNDYFPRTATSNWSYETDDVANDSLLIRAKSTTISFGGFTYNTFEATDDANATPFQDIDSYRKENGSYYRYTDLQSYFGFDASQKVAFIFLKDDQAVGHTWTSDPYTGTAGGTSIKVRIRFTITQKDINANVVTSVGSITYPNTIVVEERYEIDPGTGTWMDATSVLGFFRDYYARDIGWILDEYFEPGNTTTPASKLELRRAQVVQ